MSGYRLNVDLWHVVNPDDQKVHRLSRGDKVPSWALDNEGVDIETLTTGFAPTLVKDEEASTGTQAAREASVARGESPKQEQDKK